MQAVYIKKFSAVCLRLLAGVLLLAGLRVPLQAAEVWVTLEPQAFVVEQIGGDAVTVRVLVPPGRSPATYAPSPSEVNALARSDLFFGIGVPTEGRLLERMQDTLRQVRVVGSDTWVLEVLVATVACGAEGQDHDGHSCGPGDGSVLDPHVWMDPWQMMSFGEKVAAELSQLHPDAAPEFAARLEDLKQRLQALDAEIRDQLEATQGGEFFINHASLGHFAARYGLRQRSIEHFGSQPSARRISEMLREARQSNTTALLAQVQFSRSTADVLAQALDVPVLTVDPLRRDYFANLREVTQVLRQALGEVDSAVN